MHCFVQEKEDLQKKLESEQHRFALDKNALEDEVAALQQGNCRKEYEQHTPALLKYLQSLNVVKIEIGTLSALNDKFQGLQDENRDLLTARADYVNEVRHLIFNMSLA